MSNIRTHFVWKIIFRLDVNLFRVVTFQLSNYFQPTQNSEEPLLVTLKSEIKNSGILKVTEPVKSRLQVFPDKAVIKGKRVLLNWINI